MPRDPMASADRSHDKHDKRTIMATTHKKITRTALFIALLLAAASCASHKNAQQTPASPAKRPGVAAMRNAEISTVAETYSPWTTFYAPFNMRLSKPIGFNISGRATMIRDQAVQLSFRMLGMEVAVAYVTTDSAKIIDKFHKYIVALPFSSISAKTGLTVGDFQNILLGQAFYPGQGTIRPMTAETQFSVSHNGDNMVMTPRRTPDGATWYFTVAPGPELRALSVEPDGLAPFTVTFGDVVASIAGSVASTVEANGKFRDKELRASISWNMEKAKWNENRTIDIPDYSNYQRLSPAGLIKILKKF